MHVDKRKNTLVLTFLNVQIFFEILVFWKFKEFNILDMAQVVYNPHESRYTFWSLKKIR